MPCCGSDPPAPTPTEELYTMAKGNLHDEAKAQQCVLNGADVCYTPSPSDPMSAVHLFASKGHYKCFEECLKSTTAIDFTGKDEKAWETSILHYTVASRSEEDAEKLISAVKARLQRRVAGDHCDWSMMNRRGDTTYSTAFMAEAADNNLLHTVYPKLKDLPYFANMISPIPMADPVCETDWEKLTEEEQQKFLLLNGVTDHATTALWKVCRSPKPDRVRVREWVDEGAKIQRGMAGPVSSLERLIMHGSVDGVAACMKTKQPIHFTMDENGRNILLLTCQDTSVDVAVAILKTMVQRIEEKVEGDTVNWLERNASWNDFFSNAAYYDMLHRVWPLVKELEEFRERTAPIPVYSRITQEDWDKLGEDQRFFKAEAGFVPLGHRLRGVRYHYRDGKLATEPWEEVSWEAQRELGVGSFGPANLALLSNKCLVTVKVQRSSNQVMECLSDMAVMEVEVMKCMRHKNIAEFYATQHLAGKKELQIISEYCEGLGEGSETVALALQKSPDHFTIKRVRRYAKQMLEGLAYLHRNKLLHGDLKPSNVLLTKDGEHIKLTDFGCSRKMKEASSSTALHTSVPFTAPEVLDPSRGCHATEFSDIWSLGCTVLAMMGHHPWGDDEEELSVQQLQKKICDADGMPSGVPETCGDDKLLQFLHACFQRAPEERLTAQKLLKHPWITCPDSKLKKP